MIVYRYQTFFATLNLSKFSVTHLFTQVAKTIVRQFQGSWKKTKNF